MSSDERGVTLRDLRHAGSFGPEEPTSTPESRSGAKVLSSQGTRRDPAVPADIVARARAAMRQANDPAPPEGSPAPDHPARHADSEFADSLSMLAAEPRTQAQELASAGGGPTAAERQRSAGECALLDEDEAVSDEQALDEASLHLREPDVRGDTSVVPDEVHVVRPLVRAPWEMSEPQQVDDPGQADVPGQAERRWSGYNPDYVADQLVPLIHARATTGWRGFLGLQPSKAEQRRKELQAAMCVNFGQPIKVVLANPRGYAGKTVLSVCLAGVFGLARVGGVCEFENHELSGVMALRPV
ncbi:MAG: hypothetical protein L0H41_17850, partial [Microlunatus sp.]|nr:hypothetical protein [Microlunatus sp.]